MSYQFITCEVNDGVQTITLNRPEVYNALNDEITFELQRAFKEAADEAVRVVVLAGAGKAFCSGQDLKSAPMGTSYRKAIEKRYNPLVRAMRDLPKPVVGKLQGVAAGAGASLILACDVIVASEDATLVEAFVNIGLVPDSGSSWFLTKIAGQAKAFEWCTMGNKITAAEAAKWGLVNRVVPTDQLDQAIGQVTGWYAKAPTKTIGLIKKILQKATAASLDEILDYEAVCQDIAGASPDHKEGVMAFLEKRAPVFSGK